LHFQSSRPSSIPNSSTAFDDPERVKARGV
jgi:hypothetical protein